MVCLSCKHNLLYCFVLISHLFKSFVHYDHRQEIFLIITVAAVVTNAGLAIFTMQGLDYLDTTTR